MSRIMEFKMEREGVLSIGQDVEVAEGTLPSNYYYTINPALAMSGNIPFSERLRSRKGRVIDIVQNERGFYVSVEFLEEEI